MTSSQQPDPGQQITYRRRSICIGLPQVCAYIRPEADFTTVEDLIARIHKDADVTRAALQDSCLAAYAADDGLKPSPVL